MRKEMNLIGAIGKRPCEISLQKIMQELGDRKLVNRVMGIILDYREGLRQIAHVPNMLYRKRFTFEWRQQFFDRVFKNDFPQGVRTHLWCCMTAYHREHIRTAITLNLMPK
jgi:hypothetical protein